MIKQATAKAGIAKRSDRSDAAAVRTTPITRTRCATMSFSDRYTSVVPLIHTAYVLPIFPAQLASFPSHHEEVWSMAASTTNLSMCLYLHIERAPPHRHTFNTG